MDKVAYHFNKKKLRAKTDGKFLYYYPCNEEDKANTFLYGKGYFVIEVTEKEWGALFELDRFEYNNWHKVYRHNEPFPENEERLSLEQQQKWINRDVPLAVTTAERIDRIRSLSTLTKRERKVYCLSVDDEMTQKDIAEELGITQGAVSSTFRRARRKLDAYDLSKDNTPDDMVWTLWQIFMRDYELPDFLDVEIEFVIRGILQDDNFIREVARKAVEIHNADIEESAELKILNRQKADIDKQLANITNAICQGIFNQHTQAKMIELSNTQRALEAQIADEQAKTILPLKEARVVAFLKNYTEIVKCADKSESLDNMKRLFDVFIKEVIFDGERFLIVMKTTNEPLDPENGQKEEATRKKFELLRFGEHKRNQSELTKMNHWRYCYCSGMV